MTAFVAALFLSCSGGDDNPELREREIYILGRLNVNGQEQPVYFKDDERIELPSFPGERVFLNNITVSENDQVTISGNRFDGQRSPVYWTDNQLFEPNLAGRSFGSSAGHVEHQGDIYVYGNVEAPGGNVQACYWKNESLVLLESNFDYTEATGLAFVNGSIVVIGYAFVRSLGNVPVFWRDGVVNQLRVGSSRNISPSDIEVSGNDFYVLGMGTNNDFEVVIGVWKNEELTEFTRPESNMVSHYLQIVGPEQDVQFSLTYTDQANTVGYYANGSDKIVESTFDHLFSIQNFTVAGNDTYILGSLFDGSGFSPPYMWVNGATFDFDWPERFEVADLFIREP